MEAILQYRRIGQFVEHTLKEPNYQLKQQTPQRGDLERNEYATEDDVSSARSPSRVGSTDELTRKVVSIAGTPARRSSDASPELQHDDKDDKTEVQTDGPNDPTDPHNWPMATRCKVLVILFLLIFTQGWAGACDSRANETASKEFHVSRDAESLETAMYLLGVGTAALFVGPLSETVGRNPMYLATTFCYMLFVLGSALVKNLTGQPLTRFLVGLFAATTLTINGSSVGDMFGPLERSLAFPVIALANIAAPVIAPIAGGWIAENPSLAYAWTEWIALIISAAAFVTALLFLPETYPPLLIEYKTKHLRRLTNDSRYSCKHENESVLARLEETLPRPVTFFTKEPVVITLGTYLILLYIILFSFLSGFDYIFTRTYRFSTGLTGSTFAAVAAGAIFSTCLSPVFYLVDRRALQRARSIPPETRLWPAIVASPFLPISLFWLGWTNYPSISPWSGLAACFVFGYALMAIYISSYQYIIDIYASEAASALASITMARYIIAAGMVMVTRPMYKGIGVHWVLTLLGCMGTVLAPAPLLFWKLEEKVRAKSTFAK